MKTAGGGIERVVLMDFATKVGYTVTKTTTVVMQKGERNDVADSMDPKVHLQS